jgi:hypothetical protein
MIATTIVAIIIFLLLIILAYIPLAYEPNFQNLGQLFDRIARRAVQEYIRQEQAEEV